MKGKIDTDGDLWIWRDRIKEFQVSDCKYTDARNCSDVCAHFGTPTYAKRFDETTEQDEGFTVLQLCDGRELKFLEFEQEYITEQFKETPELIYSNGD